MHGREAYRRNSFLIIYSFYKNFLYIIAQYFFGFWSAFSGQVLYEKVIYQLFNITFTSFPIMWYAVSDFQHERDRPEYNKEELRHDFVDDQGEYNKTYFEENKSYKELLDEKKEKKTDKTYSHDKKDDQYFLRNPTLYKPGMDNKYFSESIMI